VALGDVSWERFIAGLGESAYIFHHRNESIEGVVDNLGQARRATGLAHQPEPSRLLAHGAEPVGTVW
jgi:hypothetical protein